MNKTQMKGHWNELRGKAKQNWGNLTDDDLLYQEGQEDELFGRIQQRTGETMEAIQRKFEEWTR